MNRKAIHLARIAVLLAVSIVARISDAADPVVDNFAASPDGDWPTIGGDWSNSRHSALAQINTRTVDRLGLAWISEKFDDGSMSVVTPIVKDGLLFVTAGRKIYALNAGTGARVWRATTVADAGSSDVAGTSDAHQKSSPTPASVPNRRGVAVGQGLVFVGLHDGRVIALEQATGAHVWSQQTGTDEPKKEQVVSGAPIYSHGIVFVGLSNGDARLRGRITAMDAATGKILWQRFAVPAPGEAGFETWPANNDAWKFGGAGVWTNAAVDWQLGMVYFTTGNAVPPFAGDFRQGENLFTCSVLALDIRTGELKWYYQLVHHDVFDADAGTPVILYDTRVDGKMRKALAVMRADGHLFQLDRVSGQPLRAVEERPVPQLASQRTALTQPYPVGGESLLMSCDDWKKEKIPAGFVLGCMWTPPASPPPSDDPQNVLAPFPSVRVSAMAYSPRTKYFYAQGASFLTWPRRSNDPYYFDFDRSAPGLKEYGELAALDSRTGRIAWKRRVDAPKGENPFLRSSLLATTGGLLFRSSPHGLLEASDLRRGEVLWTFETGMAGANGSAVTYVSNGEQYIAVPVGSAVWAFSLNGKPAPKHAKRQLIEPEDEFFGAIVDTSKIETTSLKRSSFGSGTRYFVDEFAFSPYRSRVRAGTKIRFINNGQSAHEIAALDGAWGTGLLRPMQDAQILFDVPGRYTYICKSHPWSYGQLIVTPVAPPTL